MKKYDSDYILDAIMREIDKQKPTVYIVKIVGCNSIPKSFIGRYGILREKYYGDKWKIELCGSVNNLHCGNIGGFSHTVSKCDFEIIGELK